MKMEEFALERYQSLYVNRVVADQCGLGFCDTAVTDAVVNAAMKQGAGTRVSV